MQDDIARKRADLAKAQQDIAEGEERISRQVQLVARPQAEGQVTTERRPCWRTCTKRWTNGSRTAGRSCA